MKTRSRCLPALLAAGVLLAAPLIGFGASPASAGSVDTGGGGNDSGSTAGGSSSNVRCVGAAMYEGKNKIYDVHRNCIGKPQVSNPVQKRCEYGLLVFRFWGDGNNPAAGGSVSRANLPDPCSSNNKYRVWQEHPVDAGASIPRDPWAIVPSAANNRVAQPYAAGADVPDSASVVWKANTSNPERYTPGNDIGTIGASCTAVATDNTIKTAYQTILNNTQITAAAKDTALRQIRYAILKQALTKTAGLNAGDKKTVFWSVFGLKQGSGAGEYQFRYDDATQDAWAFSAANPNAAVTGAAFLNVFSPLACSSDYNFGSTVKQPTPYVMQGAERSNFKVTGTCYIPIDRVGVKNSGDDDKWFNLASVNGNWQFGERFSTSYQGKAGTGAKGYTVNSGGLLPAWANVDNWLGAGFSASTVKSWRDSMVNWYNSQAKANKKAGGSPFMKGKKQVLPASHYVKSGSSYGSDQNMDYTAADADLMNGSKCDLNIPTITVKDSTLCASSVCPPSTKVDASDLAVYTVLDSPNNLYAGGLTHEATYSLLPDSTVAGNKNGLVCTINKAPCDPGLFTLDKLTYTLNDAAINTQTSSPTTPTTGTNPAYAKGTPADLAASYYRKNTPSAHYSGTDATFGFLRATPPATALQVSASNVSAVARVVTQQIATGTTYLWDETTGTFITIPPVVVDITSLINVSAGNIHVRVPKHPDPSYSGYQNPAGTNTANPSTWWSTRTVTSGVLAP